MYFIIKSKQFLPFISIVGVFFVSTYACSMYRCEEKNHRMQIKYIIHIISLSMKYAGIYYYMHTRVDEKYLKKNSVRPNVLCIA